MFSNTRTRLLPSRRRHAKATHKGTCHNPHGLPERGVGAENDAAGRVDRSDQGLDNVAGNRYGPFQRGEQPGNPHRAMDRMPSIPFRVEDDEDVTRKDGSHDLAFFPRVTNRSTKLWEERTETLRPKVECGNLFPVVQRLRDVPLLSAP